MRILRYLWRALEWAMNLAGLPSAFLWTLCGLFLLVVVAAGVIFGVKRLRSQRTHA